MSQEQLRWANERVRELRGDFRVHHDARGWSVTSDLSFTPDGIAANAVQQQATIVEPKRTAVEALEWAFEIFEDMKKPNGTVMSFYNDRMLKGLSLDIAPEYTPAQRARLEDERHRRKLGMERFNEGLQRQLRAHMDRIGLTNVKKVRDALRGKR